MREIRFRAWNKKDLRIEDINGINWWWGDIETKVTELELQGLPKLIDNYELMQYTGLKDKNGKDICEGDILAYNGMVHPQAVTFSNGSFLVGGLGASWVVNQWRGIIIGNIHENKELLK